MASTDLIFNGLWHLAGETVAATIAGLDCGNFAVAADGSITVPLQSDAGGLLTADYIISQDGIAPGVEQNTSIRIYDGSTHVTVTVPVTIGAPYTSRGQTLRPATEADIKSRTGAALGKVRRGSLLAALLSNTSAVGFGTDFANLDDAQLTTGTGDTAMPQTSMFSGVFRNQTLKDDYGFDTMVAWEISRPWPCTIAAVSVFLDAVDDE